MDVQDLSDCRYGAEVEGKMPSGALKQARQTAILGAVGSVVIEM